MNLKQKILSSIKWTTATTFLTALGSIIQLYILVQFIAEKDFGLMAIVNVVLAFATMFLDVGINNGIIFQQKITDVQLSSLYWVSILMGFVLGLMVFLGSPFIAAFYDEALLIPILQIVAFIFIIRGFGQQYRVILKKHLHFNSLSKIDLSSFLISFVTVIFLAVKGYGVYALAVALLIKYSVDTILSIGFGWSFFKPQFKISLKEIHFFIRFGGFQMGERFINFFNSQFDTLIIGKILGMEALGVYDVLKRFLVRPFSLINGLIGEISFPVMAKFQQDNEQLKQVYLRIMNYVGSLNFPIYIFLFFQADLIILFMFGQAWLAHQFIFEMLCIYVLVYSTGNPIGNLILAKGRVALGFYWNIGVVCINLPVIWWSTKYGLSGVVIALLTLQISLAAFTYFVLVKNLITIKIEEYLKSIISPLMIAIFVGVLTNFIHLNLAVSVVLPLIASIYGILYILISQQFNANFLNTFLQVIKAKI